MSRSNQCPVLFSSQACILSVHDVLSSSALLQYRPVRSDTTVSASPNVLSNQCAQMQFTVEMPFVIVVEEVVQCVQPIQ